VKQSDAGTSNLLSHARRFHNDVVEALIKASNQGRLVQNEFDGLVAAMKLPNDGAKGRLGKYGFSARPREHVKIEKQVALLTCMIAENQPFHLLDSPHFTHWMATLNAEYPSRATLMKLLPVLYEIASGHYEQMIRDSGAVTLTFDLWTSLAQSKYLVVTYEFADESFHRHSIPLDLIPVTGGAFGESIATLIRGRLAKRNLNVLVVSTVSDSGANCVLAKQLLTPGDDEPCFLHNLDHVVKGVLSNGDLVLGKDFSALVSAIGAIRGSAQLRDWLAERCVDETKELELILPSVTRWIDYYRALERAVSLSTALQRLWEDRLLEASVDRGTVPDDFLLDDYWDRLRTYIALLKKFYLASRNAQSLSSPTLSCVPRWIAELRATCVRKASDSMVVAEVKTALLSGIEQRLSVFVDVAENVMPNAIKAALLDPRESNQMQATLSEGQLKVATDAIVADTVLLFGDADDPVVPLVKQTMRGGAPNMLKTLAAANLERDADALKWWREFAAKCDPKRTGLFVSWCRAARMFLAMPAGSSPSEFAFSATTNIVTKKRTLLADETLAMTMTIHHFVKDPAFKFDDLVQAVLKHGVRDEEDEKGEPAK
jgi:hypothetical protein